MENEDIFNLGFERWDELNQKTVAIHVTVLESGAWSLTVKLCQEFGIPIPDQKPVRKLGNFGLYGD